MAELQVVEQKEIAFLDGQVTAVLVQDADGRENVYVPLRPLVESMGLNWSGQRQRIKKNGVLDRVCISVGVTHSDIPEGSRRPKSSRYLAIPISHLNGFLFGISAERVKEEIRPLIVAYQARCYEVLFQAFNGTESMRRFYTAVGFDKKWIDARVQKHTTFTELADMWLLSGVPIEHHDQLEDLLNEGTFGLTREGHRAHKGVTDGALTDHMTRMELIMSMYADEANRRLIHNEEPSGLDENSQLTRRAGQIAGQARRDFEEKTGSQVLSKGTAWPALPDGEEE